MTQTGPFQRVNTVSAPLKGSFPLDHEGACKYEMLKSVSVFDKIGSVIVTDLVKSIY